MSYISCSISKQQSLCKTTYIKKSSILAISSDAHLFVFPQIHTIYLQCLDYSSSYIRTFPLSDKLGFTQIQYRSL